MTRSIWNATVAVLAAPVVLWLVLWASGFQLGFNLSPSLPGHVYIIEPGVMPVKGEVICFRAPETARYFTGFKFLKLVRGVEGDVVEHQNGFVFINGQRQVKILSTTLSGDTLVPGPSGVVPANTFFVLGKHERSYDSRYKSIGFISKDRVIGRAFLIF